MECVKKINYSLKAKLFCFRSVFQYTFERRKAYFHWSREKTLSFLWAFEFLTLKYRVNWIFLSIFIFFPSIHNHITKYQIQGITFIKILRYLNFFLHFHNFLDFIFHLIHYHITKFQIQWITFIKMQSYLNFLDFFSLNILSHHKTRNSRNHFH